MSYVTRRCDDCGGYFTPVGECNLAARPGCGLLFPSIGAYCWPCIDRRVSAILVEIFPKLLTETFRKDTMESMTDSKYFVGDETVNGERDVCERNERGGYVVLATIRAHDARALVDALNKEASK